MANQSRASCAGSCLRLFLLAQLQTSLAAPAEASVLLRQQGPEEPAWWPPPRDHVWQTVLLRSEKGWCLVLGGEVPRGSRGRTSMKTSGLLAVMELDVVPQPAQAGWSLRMLFPAGGISPASVG